MSEKSIVTFVDNECGANVDIPYIHHQVHIGKLYHVGDQIALITSTGTYYGITTSSTGEVHVVPARITSSADKLSYYVYEDSSYTGGTPMNIIYNNRISHITATINAVKAPSITSIGNLMVFDYLPGSTGVGQARSGSADSFENEFVLKPNTKYLAYFFNGSSATNNVYFRYTVYELN